VLLDKGETVLQVMIDRLTNIDVSYGMEIGFGVLEPEHLENYITCTWKVL
jgi:hypothetical protein